MTVYQVEIECIFLKRRWLVEMSGGEDPVFTFRRDGWRPWREVNQEEQLAWHQTEREILDQVVWPAAVNPWLMRERFFAIKEPIDALSFFREFGLWRYKRHDCDDHSIKFQPAWTSDSEGEPLQVTFDQLANQRNFFEDALSEGPSEWVRLTRATGKHRSEAEDESDAELRASQELVYFFGGNSCGPKVGIGLMPEMSYPGPFHGRITCHEIQDALRATILLDWMEGREWPKCKECGIRFKRTSKHPQIYCRSRCSSKVRQERFRNKPKTSKRGK